MSQENNKKEIKSNKKIKKQIAWSLVSVLFIALIIAGYFFYQHIVSGLPSLDQLENPKQSLASNVFSSDGQKIGQYFRQNRIETNIDSLPPFVVEALVSTEDRSFYKHWGVDLQRFIKAMFKNIFLFKREGASTITQQLAKNLYSFKVTRENLFQTGVRKIREWITAVQIEKTYTKREILEMYFNTSYFGNRAYGIEMASQIYFNKRAEELTLPEAAVLIALLKSSVYYNPKRHYENALRRRNLVMHNMVVTGNLTQDEYDKLKKEPIKLVRYKFAGGVQSVIAPHFVEYVRQKLEKLSDKYHYNLYEDGLTITTSLDTRMQKIANRVVKEHLDGFQKKFDKYWKWNEHRDLLTDIVNKAIKSRRDYLFAAREEKNKITKKLWKDTAFIDSVKKVAQTIEVGFVVLDVKTGEIRAMVGGRNQDFSYGLNHVTQIRRQPGSAFKPIVYTVALDNGLYPAYPILDQEFVYGSDKWNPHNFDKSVNGFLTLRDGLKNSVNLISARLIIEGYAPLYQIGQYAEKLGITTKLDLVPSIALGTSLVIPLDLVSVYATFANHGIHNDPMGITQIEDKNGILLANFFSKTREAISEDTDFLITNMLETVINEGTGIRTRVIHHFMRPAAGKTGTTQGFGDAWFMGFTPQLAAGVWVGFDDRRIAFTGAYGQGARAANPIWSNFMREVYDSLKLPEEDFQIPESGNIVQVKFCKESIYKYGDPKLYSQDCESGAITDYINIRDIPKTFNAQRDSKIKVFSKYWKADSLSHEALEIDEE